MASRRNDNDGNKDLLLPFPCSQALTQMALQATGGSETAAQSAGTTLSPARAHHPGPRSTGRRLPLVGIIILSSQAESRVL